MNALVSPRPALRYLGGKWKMARRILPWLPPHRTYVEPFGGAGSVLVHKAPAYAEIYNDLDGEVVNLFGVLRDPIAALELERRIILTPFARDEFLAAYGDAEEPVERARRLVIRSFQGYGNISYRRDRTTGFRRFSNKSGTTSAHDWANYPPAVAALAQRFRGVVIENRPAAEVISYFDGARGKPAPEGVLFYVDPPYVQSTRSEKRCQLAPSTGYLHEMDDAGHAALLEQLLRIRGMVVLSGYATPLYDDALQGWRRLEFDAHADGARPRVEVLWINPAACAAHGLFAA